MRLLAMLIQGGVSTLLGKGTHGQVWRVPGGALKVFTDLDCLEQEYQMHLACKDIPGLVKLIDRTHENALLLEYLPGVTLDQLCGRMSEQKVLSISRQLIKTLSHLHAHLLLHRDLKSSNVIISPDGQATIIDLGSMRQLSTADEAVWTLGSWPWMPPEVLIDGQPLTMKGEIWSMGMLMVEMVLGETLIEHHNDNVVQRLEEIRYIDRFVYCSDPTLMNMIRMALEHDPAQRAFVCE